MHPQHESRRPQRERALRRFTTIPGLGPTLARRIVDRLGITTLEALECAAMEGRDGQLARLPGFGKRRIARLRRQLETALTPPRPSAAQLARPSVGQLLELDGNYRELVARRALPLVAPRRFNPEQHAWLPVWSSQCDRWDLTVMFSNTATAHELGKQRDWVLVIYAIGEDSDHATIVTEHEGPLVGRRVVRGRESECIEHYRDRRVAPAVRAWVREQVASL